MSLEPEFDGGETTKFEVNDPRGVVADLDNNLPVLVCLKGDYPREAFLLKAERTSVGRVAQCDITLPMPNVSRIHAFIKYLNPGAQGTQPVCHIVDNQSTNGTWVNGDQIHESRALKHGDLITIGDFVFGYFVRKETELVIEERSREALSRYGQTVLRGRVPSDLEVRLRIIIPENTFTPAIIPGMAKDVSMTGLRFVTTHITEDFFKSLLAGNRFIRCELTLQALRKTHELPGRMAWVHFDNKTQPHSCVMGIEFKDMGGEAREDLRAELQVLTENLKGAVPDGDRR